METNFKLDVPSFALGYSAGKEKGGSGGGMELNIAYGDTPPEDTSKLWAKCEKPSKTTMCYDSSMSKIEGTGNLFMWTTYSTYANSFNFARAIGDLVYFFETRGRIRSYNITSKSTTTVLTGVTFLENLLNVTIEAVGNKIYFIGGNKKSGSVAISTNEIWVFDTETNEYAQLETTLPVACAGSKTAVIGSKVYLFGGAEYTYTDAANVTVLDTIMEFDTETSEIELLEEKIPTPLFEMAACVVYESNIYLFGGRYGRSVTDYSKKIYKFDPQAKTIASTGKSLSYGLGKCGSAIIGDWVLLIGGEYHRDGSNTSSNRLEITAYNLRTWKMAEVSSLSFSFVGAYVHVYNDRAYVIGGSKSTANNYIYLWYPYHYTINRDEMVIILASSNPFNVIDTNSLVVNVGVSRAFIGDENNMSEPVELSRYNKGEWATS